MRRRHKGRGPGLLALVAVLALSACRTGGEPADEAPLLRKDYSGAFDTRFQLESRMLYLMVGVPYMAREGYYLNSWQPRLVHIPRPVVVAWSRLGAATACGIAYDRAAALIRLEKMRAIGAKNHEKEGIEYHRIQAEGTEGFCTDERKADIEAFLQSW